MERGESGSQPPFLYYSHSLLTLAFYSLKGQSHSAGQRGSKCSNVCNVHSPWDALPKKRLFFIKFTNRRGTNQKNICKFDTVAQAFLQYKGSLQKSVPCNRVLTLREAIITFKTFQFGHCPNCPNSTTPQFGATLPTLSAVATIDETFT